MTEYGPAEMMSCDSARWSWFTLALQSRRSQRVLQPGDLAEIKTISDEIKETEAPSDCPVQTAFSVEHYFGWPTFQGVILSPAGEPVSVHWWNLLPDGSVLDALATGPDIAEAAVFPPGTDEWRRYRREWHAAYNPDLAERFPELEGVSWTGEADIARIMRSRAARVQAEAAEAQNLPEPRR
jgi:hypothetical protein